MDPPTLEQGGLAPPTMSSLMISFTVTCEEWLLVPTFSTEVAPPTFQLFLLHCFSPSRCVFASNFPVDKINGTYQQLLSALEPILSAYSKEDQQKFYAGNARKFYRL